MFLGREHTRVNVCSRGKYSNNINGEFHFLFLDFYMPLSVGVFFLYYYYYVQCRMGVLRICTKTYKMNMLCMWICYYIMFLLSYLSFFFLVSFFIFLLLLPTFFRWCVAALYASTHTKWKRARKILPRNFSGSFYFINNNGGWSSSFVTQILRYKIHLMYLFFLLLHHATTFNSFLFPFFYMVQYLTYVIFLVCVCVCMFGINYILKR